MVFSPVLAQSAVHYLGMRDACVGGGAGEMGRGVGAGEEGGPRPGRHQQHRQHECGGGAGLGLV